MRCLLAIFIVAVCSPALGKSRDPKDYPQRAKVLEFRVATDSSSTSTQCTVNPPTQYAGYTYPGTVNCLGGSSSMRYHLLTVEIDGRDYRVSCFRCAPLTPGETYPARIGAKDHVIEIIHQKENGSWGQDTYHIRPVETPASSAVPAATTRARVHILSEPDDAEIQIDGSFAGDTPSAIDLAPGDHTIVLEKNGFKVWTRKIRITGGDVTVTGNLQR